MSCSRIEDRAPDFVQQRARIAQPGPSFFWQNWRFSANSRFFAENSLQIWGPGSAVFWRFLAKTAKKGKKNGSLVELVGTGRVLGRRTGRGSGCLHPDLTNKRPSLVDLVPDCRVLVRRAPRELPGFRGFRAEIRGSRIELHGARYVWRGPQGPGPGMIH